MGEEGGRCRREAARGRGGAMRMQKGGGAPAVPPQGRSPAPPEGRPTTGEEFEGHHEPLARHRSAAAGPPRVVPLTGRPSNTAPQPP